MKIYYVFGNFNAFLILILLTGHTFELKILPIYLCNLVHLSNAIRQFCHHTILYSDEGYKFIYL